MRHAIRRLAVAQHAAERLETAPEAILQRGDAAPLRLDAGGIGRGERKRRSHPHDLVRCERPGAQVSLLAAAELQRLELHAAAARYEQGANALGSVDLVRRQ